MADCDWVILCDYAFQDAARRMCMVGTIDNIHAKQVPAIHQQLSIVMRFIGDADETLDVKAQVISPDNSMLAEIGGPIKLSPTGTAVVHLKIIGLRLPEFGVYSVGVFAGNNLSKNTTFILLGPKTSTT